jgi:hypothetical protein
MTTTPNLAIAYIDSGVPQPEVTHNDAIRSLDALVQLIVQDRDLATPPGSPSDGQRWIVAGSPTGAWTGHSNHVLAWQDGAWRSYVPKVGWLAYVVDEGMLLAWSGSAWVDAMSMLTTLQNLLLLGIGTTADSTNPLSAKLNNTLWVAKTVAEGGDGNLRYKLSKENASKTLSLLMQTNSSGRAELGLTGDDDFHFKVSPDGTTWAEALTISRSNGGIRFLAAETDVASAATCNIGSATNLKVRITGTTTITSFGTVANVLRFVRFAGALTLTHNATSLILPGAANITTAAGDTCVAVSDGSGNWRVCGYQKADGTPLAFGASSLTPLMMASSVHGYALPMVNGTIVESHASSAVTFAIKTLAGNDPSATDPVDFFFRDATAATGDYVRRRITAALSVTVASTKTLGTANGVPFRVWLVVVDTGSSVELGVVNCVVGGSTPTSIFPLDDDQLVSPTATPANNAGVIYTTSGQSSKPFRPIGFASYESGLATAGTWGSSPTKLQLFGPGIPLPGQPTGRRIQATTSTQTDTTSGTFVDTSIAAAITPASAANLVKVEFTGSCYNANTDSSRALIIGLHRGATLVGPIFEAGFVGGAAMIGAMSYSYMDAPGSASSTTYTAQVKMSAAGGVTSSFPYTGNSTNGYISLEEIMG